MITRRDLISYTIGLFLGALFMFFTKTANAYDINVYDAPSRENHSVIEVINDCGKNHKLLISNDNLHSINVIDWVLKVLDLC